MDGENVEKNQCGTIQHDFFEVIARLIYGTLTGTAIDIEDMLAFSVLENVRPMIESAPDFRTTYRASPIILGRRFKPTRSGRVSKTASCRHTR
jgi:hypothetical protein